MRILDGGGMIKRCGSCVCAIVLCLAQFSDARAEAEVTLTDKEFKELDQFEAFALQKADKAFLSEKKEYKQAAAEYEAFALDNPRSKALPYALLRKARCIQLSNKRNAAVKAYQEVVDFFPDNVMFAGAALFYIGQCWWDDSEPDKALKAWAVMVENPKYKTHYLAATALNMLAENMMKQEKTAKAIEFFKQVAIDFRTAHPEAARHAMWNQVIPYYIRTLPDEPKLREFYVAVKTFENDPHNPHADANEDKTYWTRIREYVPKYGVFTDIQADQRKQYYSYWAQQMSGKFPDWDDFQIDAATFQRSADGNAADFAQRIDAQFAKYQKNGDYARVVKWIHAYAEQKAKRAEYYAKLDFAKMPNPLLHQLMTSLYDTAKDPAMARNVFGQIRLGEMPDAEKTNLARHIWQRDGDMVKVVAQAYKDAPMGQMELLRYYHSRQDGEKGLPLCEQLRGVPEYTKEVLWKKAEFYHWKEKWNEAIAAYRESDSPPQSLFRISEVFIRMGKIDPALEELRQIDNFFPDSGADAYLRIAHIYRDAQMKDKYKAALRVILKKYPKSAQSSDAHRESEKMDARNGGGVDAE